MASSLAAINAQLAKIGSDRYGLAKNEKSHRDVLSAYLGTYCRSGVEGVGGSLVLPIEADRQLLEKSHRL